MIETPTLASIETSAEPTRNGSSSACSTRSATASASASDSRSSARITNSSPPSRATVSVSRSISARRSETEISRWSPTAWPRLSLIALKRSRSMNSSAIGPLRAAQPRDRLARAVHQQQPVRQLRERVVQRLALEPHAVGDVLGGRVPGLAVAARAPQQPAPGAVAVAVAVGEVHELRGPVVPGERQRERLLEVVGVDELLHRVRFQLLDRPAEQLLPGGVQQREVPVERDRREQVAGHLEQPPDPRLVGQRRVGHGCARGGRLRSRWGSRRGLPPPPAGVTARSVVVGCERMVLLITRRGARACSGGPAGAGRIY